MFTADVAVDDHNEIAQDSSCMLELSQGTFCRVVDFWITTAPAIGLSRVPQKTTKTTLLIIWFHMLVSWLHEPEETRKKRNDSYSYVLVQQYKYYLDIEREKSSPTLWNHIFKLERRCRGARSARKLLSLCRNCSEST